MISKMMFLQILLSTVVVTVVASQRFRRQVELRDTETFQTLPRRALAKPGGKLTLLGNAGVPLQSCLFYLPWPRNKWAIDFSLGPASNATDDRYEYFGAGLEFGDCGMRIKRIADDDDGIIQCEISPVGSDGPHDTQKCATTLRVTDIRETELPVFDIEPSHNLISLARGDDIAITCNADRPINLCHIYLPGPIFLNLDNGANSTATSEHRYYGNGLDKGECGASLTNVTERLSGFVVCKVGSWPETLHGKWETDSFQVITKEFRSTPNLPKPPPTTNSNATVCPPLVDQGVTITCTFAGRPTDCSMEQRIHSKAKMECKNGYVIPSHIIHRTTTCLKGGIWHPPPITCKPDCGRRITNEGEVYISNGNDSMIGEFPWHVGIYQMHNNEPVQACGGSLISPGVVVSAAHCFWDNNAEKQRPASLYRVAGGKHRREWDHTSSWVQRTEVQEILLPKEYHGRGNNFNADIALVRLKTPFEITGVVNLVCLDTNHEFDHKQLVTGSEGIVTGWGFTENNIQSDILQYLGLPYRTRELCLNSLSITLQPLLTEDKFCAGFINRSKSVCRGDSGGGLVFLEPRTNKYYLRGLVSLAFKSEQGGNCNLQDYTGFTEFDRYQDWILDNLYFDYSKLKNTPTTSTTTTPMPTRPPLPRPTTHKYRPSSKPNRPYTSKPPRRPTKWPTTIDDIIVFPQY